MASICIFKSLFSFMSLCDFLKSICSLMIPSAVLTQFFAPSGMAFRSVTGNFQCHQKKFPSSISSQALPVSCSFPSLFHVYSELFLHLSLNSFIQSEPVYISQTQKMWILLFLLKCWSFLYLSHKFPSSSFYEWFLPDGYSALKKNRLPAQEI